MTRSGSIATGLTQEDESRLETAIGYPSGHLSKTNIDFWSRYVIVLDGSGLILDTDNAHDELAYHVLLAHKRVADGATNMTASTDYLLANQESEAVAKNKINRRKRDAIIEFVKMTPEQMRKCLRILGINSSNLSINVAESTLEDFINNNPTEFFTKWVENTNRDIEYLINQAVTKNIIRKNKSTYYYGTDVLGGTIEDTIAYLKDKSNSDIRKVIMTATESKSDVSDSSDVV